MSRLKYLLKYLPAVISILLLAGCGSAGSNSGGLKSVPVARVHVGIIGLVRRSPIYPVARPGVENSAPVAGARITVAREGRETLGVIESDSAGVFAMVLAPGAYRLTPQPIDGASYPNPPAAQQVVVPDDEIG
ncbi:MAG: carboxypeptidase-like regulatory domain-containing protein, partial [Bacteroidota bacterium]